MSVLEGGYDVREISRGAVAHVGELSRLATGASSAERPSRRPRGASVISEMSSGDSWGSEPSDDESDEVSHLVVAGRAGYSFRALARPIRRAAAPRTTRDPASPRTRDSGSLISAPPRRRPRPLRGDARDPSAATQATMSLDSIDGTPLKAAAKEMNMSLDSIADEPPTPPETTLPRRSPRGLSPGELMPPPPAREVARAPPRSLR